MSNMTIDKKADVGNPAGPPPNPSGPGQDTQFERTFADLAYAFLKDKAPKLLDYLVGFQVIDKNEEIGRAHV